MGSNDSNAVLVARHCADEICDVVAVAVGAPDRILVGTRDFPGNVIAACRLHRADRRPGAKLTCRNVGAGIFQRGTRAGTAIKIIDR